MLIGLVRLLPDTWVRVPGTPVELLAECCVVVPRGQHGIWNVGMVPGRLLSRIVLPDGRRSWPWPRPPLPWRQP
jgi:hypothetical protein